VFATLQRSLENPFSRILLSVAIIISLVPHEWMHATDAWFAVLFGPEVVARTLLAFRRESLPVAPGQKLETGWRMPSMTDVGLLVLDFIAVISFMPVIASSLVGARWLRLFRLTRTVLLLRYWAPVVRDLWTVSWRPERRRQLVFVFGSLIVTCFAGAVLLDHMTTAAGDDFDGDGVVGDRHDHQFLVRMWWAFRQVEDPGNLLASPHDTGTVIVSVILTLAGLFVISFIIGIGTDVVTDLSELSRHRSPGMRGHTVLVNITPSGERLLRELLHEEFKVLPAATSVVGFRWLTQLWRNLRTRRAFVVVGRQKARPNYLNEPEFASVVYRAWNDDDDDTLMSRGDVLTARRVVLLAGESDTQPDDDTIRSLLTIVEQLRNREDDEPRQVLAEIANLDNLPAAGRAASRALPCHRTTLLPTEVLIARCVAAVCRQRGLADLLTQLLRSEGREIYAWESETPQLRLPACEGPAPLELFARAGCSPPAPDKRVVPLGLIVGSGRASDAVLNPGAVAIGQVRGLIAIADNASRVDDLVASQGSGMAGTPSAKFQAQFLPEPPLALQRVLVCGFRGATVQLLDSLLTGARPSTPVDVLLLVADEDQREQALADFAAQGVLARQGFSPVNAGDFEVGEDGWVQWTGGEGRGQAAIELRVADWTSPRTLGNLPGTSASAIDYDLILFSSDGSGESDARNTTGLMTLEALAELRERTRWPRVVAEVDDVDLAARLNERYASLQRAELVVFSIDELRALVVFQSVVVPHYGAIYEKLLDPRGRGLTPLRVTGGPRRVPYPMLAQTLRAAGKILVAVDDGGEVHFGQGEGADDGVELGRARLWVLE